MEKKENKIIKYRYIPSDKWENVNGTEDNYFENAVEIRGDVQVPANGCSYDVIESIANRLNNGELLSASKEVKYNGKQIEYIFEGKKNCGTIEVSIPAHLSDDPRHIFISKDIKTLDTLCNTTKNIRNLRLFKSGLKRVGTAVIAAATLAASYAGTRKLVTTLSEHPDTEHLTYNLYYGNIMAEEEFNANVQRLYESSQRIEAEQARQKELKKQQKENNRRK